MTEATPAAGAPTVLLVHGAFANGSSWAGVIGRLQAAGVQVRALVNPLRGLAGDAAYVASAREVRLLCRAPSSAFLAAWLASGIVAGVAMGRHRGDRFPWWLLGVVFGALIVPLALGAERREEPAGRARSPLTSPDQPVPVVAAIDDSLEAAAA
jgi:hypothetical protein